MGRPENFSIDCHVDILKLLRFPLELGGYASACGFNVRGGVRLNRSGAGGECGSERVVFRDHTQESRPLAMI